MTFCLEYGEFSNLDPSYKYIRIFKKKFNYDLDLGNPFSSLYHLSQALRVFILDCQLYFMPTAFCMD